MTDRAHSSSGLGRRPLKAEITGSNPVCATICPIDLYRSLWGRFLSQSTRQGFPQNSTQLDRNGSLKSSTKSSKRKRDHPLRSSLTTSARAKSRDPEEESGPLF